MTTLNKPASTEKSAIEHRAPILRRHKNKDRIDRSQLHNSNLFAHDGTEEKPDHSSAPKQDKKFS